MDDGLYVNSVWYSCKIKKMKYIKIKTCDDCPHSDHTGAFTKGGAKPCCNHDEVVRTKGNDCFNRVIEYKTDYDRVPPARVPKRIPEWCPLPDLQNKKDD